jgi:hypothetical protein
MGDVRGYASVKARVEELQMAAANSLTAAVQLTTCAFLVGLTN